MHLVTFRRGRGEPKLGAAWHERVLDLGGLAKELAAQRGAIRRGRGGFPRTMLELIQGGEATLNVAREAWEYGKRLADQQAIEELAKRRLAYPLKRVRLLAPIPSPARNIFCLGRNYADHAVERGAAVPEHPVYFTKPGTAVVGPGDEVVQHAITKELDHEVELAVVIGKRANNVAAADGYAYVAGYAIGLDITIRGPEERSLRKSPDSYAVLGPWLVTPDEIPDPGALNLRISVNGEERQNSNTKYLILGVPELIEYASSFYTLNPGDVIITGTPEGVSPIQPGDVITACIERIGTMDVHVRAA